MSEDRWRFEKLSKAEVVEAYISLEETLVQVLYDLDDAEMYIAQLEADLEEADDILREDYYGI